MNFYELLSELCYSKGISPNKLCKDIGLSNATATKWKHGATPNNKNIALIADYFKMSPIDFANTIKTIDMISAVHKVESQMYAEQLNNPDYIKQENHFNRVMSAYIHAPLHIKKAILMILEMEEEIDNCNVFENWSANKQLTNFNKQ